MKISFIGYGSMTEALASRWANNHELFIGGRNLDKARALAKQLGDNIGYGTSAEAASFGDIVVLATTHETVFDAMNAAGGPDAFVGKVLIDINNPVRDYQNDDFLVKNYDGLSLSEAIAKYAPQAHVVKAFNTCQATVWKMDPPLFDGRPLVVLYVGDDADAKAKVATLIAEIGCEPLDFGALRYAQLLEPLAAIVIKMLFSGRDVHTVMNLIQPESKPIA